MCLLHAAYAEGLDGISHPLLWKDRVSNVPVPFTAVAGLYQQLFFAEVSVVLSLPTISSSCQFLETFVSKRLFLAVW